MALLARKPEEVKPSKPKFLISGASGVGKTFFALQFPKPYLVDAEGGATREQYQKRLKEAGGAYLGKEDGAQDFKIIFDQIKSLITEKHEYKTLIIDSFTYLYMLEAAVAEEKVGNDFGKDKKEANKPARQLIRWLEKLDMNIILICHSKDKWVRQGKEIVCEGTTFDGYDKMEFILDLWIEIKGKNFIVKKSRVSSLPQGDSYPLDYSRFAELYGEDIINSEVTPKAMATEEQIKEIGELIETLNVSEDDIAKIFKKFDVESFEEMTEDQIQKGIDLYRDKINKLNGGKK